MDILRRITLKQRLWILSVLVILGMATELGFALSNLHKVLMQEKMVQVRSLIETAASIVQGQQQQIAEGTLTPEQARATAMQLIRELRYDQTNYFWLMDFQDRILMHPIKPELDGTPADSHVDANGKHLFTAMTELARNQGQGVIDYVWPRPGSDKPIPKISYVLAIPEWEWVIATGIYVDDVDTTFWRSASVMGGMGIALLIVVFLGISLISRSAISPIQQAARAMHNIGQGDGDLTQRLDESGQDEVTEMARGFNEFASRTEETIISVAQATDLIASAAEELSAITQSNNEGIDRQRAEIQQVATAVTEMSATIKEIAHNAEIAASAAFEADTQARQGGSTVDALQDANHRLAQEVAQVSISIQRFNTESISIGTVLDVIRDIAEQTNLLALNAAIEAARAGEQGRGFAVVADEVRTLASRTRQSTTEIQKMIENLRSVAQEAVQAIQTGETLTAAALEQTGQTHTALGQIIQSIDSIREMNTQVASAAEEQAVAATEIDRSVVNISDLSEESARNSFHTAESSRELSRLGEALNALVGQFKVGFSRSSS